MLLQPDFQRVQQTWLNHWNVTWFATWILCPALLYLVSSLFTAVLNNFLYTNRFRSFSNFSFPTAYPKPHDEFVPNVFQQVEHVFLSCTSMPFSLISSVPSLPNFGTLRSTANLVAFVISLRYWKCLTWQSVSSSILWFSSFFYGSSCVACPSSLSDQSFESSILLIIVLVYTLSRLVICHCSM